MKSSPALSIDLVRGKLVYWLWAGQFLVVFSLLWVLPIQVALLCGLIGTLLLVRAWPDSKSERLLLRADGSVCLGPASELKLLQSQQFLGALVLQFSGGRMRWLWPDMLSAEDAFALRRWLKLQRSPAPSQLDQSQTP